MSASDSDEDLNTSFLDGGDDAPTKGDLVWASPTEDGLMWPSLVTSVKLSGEVMVKLLGKRGKVVLAKKVVIYTADSIHETEAKKDQTWEDAKFELDKIRDKNSEGLIETKLITGGTPLSRSSKRRKTAHYNCTGFIVGDIVWAKYRNDPIWPAKVEVVKKDSLMLKYLNCEGPALRTRLNAVSQFDCSDYSGHVDAGINSPKSHAFKLAYKEAYEQFVQEHGNESVKVPFIHINFKNGLEEEPVSPKKGRNQLVFFIEKSESLIEEVIKKKKKSFYFKKHKETSPGVFEANPLFGDFAKTPLEEERVMDAVRALQEKLSEKHSLAISFGVEVILPECITRLIMRKKNLGYEPARKQYEDSCNKLTRKQRKEAREALLQPISKERKAEMAEIAALKREELWPKKRRKRA